MAKNVVPSITKGSIRRLAQRLNASPWILLHLDTSKCERLQGKVAVIFKGDTKSEDSYVVLILQRYSILSWAHNRTQYMFYFFNLTGTGRKSGCHGWKSQCYNNHFLKRKKKQRTSSFTNCYFYDYVFNIYLWIKSLKKYLDAKGIISRILYYS